MQHITFKILLKTSTRKAADFHKQIYNQIKSLKS